MGLVDGLFGAGATLAASQIDNEAADRRQRESQEWQTRERNEQNLWNLGQWERENQYNSPAAQKQRLIDAGLNPNMLYNQGVSEAASVTGSAGAAPSNYVPSTFGQGVSNALQALLNVEDLKTKRINNNTLSFQILNVQQSLQSIGNTLTKRRRNII